MFSALIAFAVMVHGQTRLSPETACFVQQCQAKAGCTNIEPGERYPVYGSGSGAVVSCLALVASDFSLSTMNSMGIRVGARSGNIVSMRIPLSVFADWKDIPGVSYLQMAARIAPDLHKAVKDTRVDSVWHGISLPGPFSGKDVIIGITDWGFDYTHPMFYDTLLQHTRIIKAWDQFRNAGPPPSGYSYGTEISGETALLAAQCDTFNIYEWATHGSHVAGIAGGSGAGTQYRGAAYEAGYLMATFLVDEGAVMDAYQWMKDYAEAEGKRLVINMSWGLYYFGAPDGTSLLSQVIDQMSDEGVVFVNSGGNNGDAYFHIKHDFASDTMRTLVRFDNYAYYDNMWGQSVIMWGTPGKHFSFSMKVFNSSFNELASTPWFESSDPATAYSDTLLFGADSLYYNFYCDTADLFNQRPHVLIKTRCLHASQYNIALFVKAPDGTLHLWNVIELTNGVGNWGLPFEAPFIDWQTGDYYYGVGMPANTKKLITVAAHQSEFKLTNGNLAGGTIAGFSSYGPTIDGRLKPDISAPGVGVVSSLSSFTNAYVAPTNVVQTISFNGRDYRFAMFSGTSMSAPMVTGIVALMLQANPWLSAAQVKDIIRLTAREDNRTGNIPDTGSIRWGWGKIHAWKAVKMALTGIPWPGGETPPAIVYPNPAAGDVYLIADPDIGNVVVVFYNLSGAEVMRNNVSPSGKLNTSKLSPGMYILAIEADGRVYRQKLLKL